MKWFVVMFLGVLSMNAFSQDEKFAIGAVLGNPTGVSAKYWVGEKQAVDAGAGFTLSSPTHFSVHSDYLFHSMGALVFKDQYSLDVYYGVGGRLRFGDDIAFGIRTPIGIVHRLENSKVEVFGEAAPVFDFISRQGIEIHVGVGARYYF